MVLSAILLLALGVAPPDAVSAQDNPNDDGGRIRITWAPSPSADVTGYEIQRSAEGDTWVGIAIRGWGARRFVDDGVQDGSRYRYRVAARSETGRGLSPETGWVTSSPQWFDMSTLAALIGMLVISGLIVFFIQMARRGAKLFIRRIAGLDAVEEAIGRATEMGRPILFVPGLNVIDDVATIAALNILGQVAKETARYGTKISVPTADPIVYTVAREVVRESYTSVGRPDAFDPDSVYFLTVQQFAFAAGVSGAMIREKPAVNLFVGMFWAESLILAETGASTGAIQIAGTDALAQLPFFITACDYTLIGEELYAASSYISGEPLLLGSLKGQDYSKAVILAAIVVLTLLALAFNLPVRTYF